MKHNYYKIESICGYHNEWFTSLGHAMYRAKELCGQNKDQRQAVTDIVDIYKCEVSLKKTQVLDMLNHGGWHGTRTKMGECTQWDGLELFDKPRPCFNTLNEHGTNVL